jgi:flavin-dependent dehydrogenase
MSQQTLPLIDRVDVLVVGGGTAGVAAAAAASRAGRRVFLGAAETYLGEDVCAAARLWPHPGAELDTPLARDLFLAPDGQRRAFLVPMQVKHRLDEELVSAGVRFLFGCWPADLLVGQDGRAAGVVFACKSGLFAVEAPAVLDATPWSALARIARVPFTPWPDKPLRVRRTVVGHRAEGDDGTQGAPLPACPLPSRAGQTAQADAFEYVFEESLAAWHPEHLARIEQTVRNRTWHREQVWSADRVDILPPDAVAAAPQRFRDPSGSLAAGAGLTGREGLFVVGPCAVQDRGEAALHQSAPATIAAGAALGARLADFAGRAPAVAAPARPLHDRPSDPGIREPCTCARFLAASELRVEGPAGADLPVLGTFDVVVAGGGTGGAPAAIAAARAGARVLLIESASALGGVGTVGCITCYYHGYREGFTAEMAAGLRAMAGNPAGYDAGRWNSEHKAEWMRRELLAAGGQVWFGATVSGARVQSGRVQGAVVNTPVGRGIVEARVVIDATGNADVAAAAGAECRVVSEDDLAVQGTGLPSRPVPPTYHNTDYTFIDDTDPVDLTRAFVAARQRFRDAFDLAQIPDTRERRQIVGDATVTPIDVYTGRTWGDVVCLSRSNFDSHGFTVHPLFVVRPPDRVSVDAWLPLRALLPRGVSGVLVTGLALSGHRDVMPVYRMQPDVQNHAYAAGLAAWMALTRKGEVRRVDVRALQRALVARGILPQAALLHRDAAAPTRAVLLSAAAGDFENHAELAALMAAPDTARLLVRQQLADAPDAARRLTAAKLLAAMGDASGAAVLIDAVRGAAWDEGWNYTGMGQFGRSQSPLDDCLTALAAARVRDAKPAVLEKLRALDATSAFSHVRAVVRYCETFGDPDFAAPLAQLLRLPGVSGHAWLRIEDEVIPPSSTDTTTRNVALRELHLLRALYACGDPDGTAVRGLRRFTGDIRGHFARHARAVLSRTPGA